MGLVAPFRGRGLGRKLLQEAIRAAHDAGLRRIELEVLASNENAIALYERTGFLHEGRKQAARVLDGRAEDILCMALLWPGERAV
jgi:ribosomal protein S18 acetylase RimI-like enzyme